jgi:hypothetical protein
MKQIITPIIPFNIYNKNIYVKDESFCPTGTFKDRLALKLTQFLKDWSGKRILISCITMGNTLASLKWVVDEYFNGYEITLCGLFPKGFGNRLLGPNSRGKSEFGNFYLKKLTDDNVFCKEVDLSNYLNVDEIKAICDNITNRKYDIHLDLSYGLDDSGYQDIIKECFENDQWDYILVPFGAGILFEEAIKYIDDNNIDATILGATTIMETSIADKLYSYYSKYFQDIINHGYIKLGNNNRHKVTVVSDDDIRNALMNITGYIHAEPSAAAAFHLVKLIEDKSGKILVINTGEGF